MHIKGKDTTVWKRRNGIDRPEEINKNERTVRQLQNITESIKDREAFQYQRSESWGASGRVRDKETHIQTSQAARG